MNKIHPLPDDIIARIAAGEVIERPVYAVKELLENAIDAKASVITIHIEEAGLKKITVIDNGEGMSKADILESFRPHTTSKIAGDTMHEIRTFGFRGEALSSIAAISDMTIASRLVTDTSGYAIELKQGNIEKSGPIGIPAGTIVTVNNLFYTVPARKKFVKSIRTEFRHIIDLINIYALSYPNVRFTLIHNKKTILDISSNQSILDRIKQSLGEKIYRNIIPIQYEDGYIKLSGYISKPQVYAYTPEKHYLFVNKRKISDKLISQAIKDAYGTLLETSAYPAAILFIDVPYELVDVNVHPRK